jgi:hypothetical protein
MTNFGEDRTQLAAYEQTPIVAVIDKICAEEGMSRADYLRQLVRADLKKRYPNKTLHEITTSHKAAVIQDIIAASAAVAE